MCIFNKWGIHFITIQWNCNGLAINWLITPLPQQYQLLYIPWCTWNVQYHYEKGWPLLFPSLHHFKDTSFKILQLVIKGNHIGLLSTIPNCFNFLFSKKIFGLNILFDFFKNHFYCYIYISLRSTRSNFIKILSFVSFNKIKYF